MDRHWDELEEDASDHFYAVFGSAVHSILEEEGADEFTEEFVFYETDGVVVTGRVDNYNMRTGVISDYKSVSVWKIKFRDFEEWRKQGLIYAWLLIKNGFEVKTCRFVAIIKDHSKRDAKRDSSYPKKPVYVHEFEVTPEGLEEIEAFIRDKVSEYKQYRNAADDDIPPCTPEQRWDKPTKYAVKKEGRKTAIRVMDTQEDADKLAAGLGKNHYVETRPGEATRCMDYCSCAVFCNYYRDNVAAAEAQDEVNWP
jgi:hypothetical protein